MEWNRQNVKNLLLVVCGGIAFYSILQHLDVAIGALNWVLGIIEPFVVGCVIAFVLNVPMRAIERHLYPKAKRGRRLRRPLAYVLTLTCVVGVITVMSVVILPSLGDAIVSLARQIPGAFTRLKGDVENLQSQLPAVQNLLGGLDIDWNQMTQKALSLLQEWGNGLLTSGGDFLGGVISGVSNFVIGFIFSIYVLMQKEKLGRQVRRCIYALFHEKAADRILYISGLASRTFSNFLSGQCLEGCILGTLFVITLSIFRIPYALLIGVLIGVSALVPVVGPFISVVVGFLLIVISDPWKAVMFIVLFIVVQQIDGNLIYPRVVGSSVGLPPIWVLVAVIVGGKLFGVVGILFFIPFCSVLYTLSREFVRRRLEKKKVPTKKLE